MQEDKNHGGARTIASPTASAVFNKLGDFTTTTRLLPIAAVAIGIGVVSAFVALALLKLIGLFTNLFFFQLSSSFSGGAPRLFLLPATIWASASLLFP